ncbi:MULTISPECIES: DUF1700 domain-containing protein [Asticcacaulis]|uniref:DUF1700 domain-containing protein n=1 Tax=Asticcacaulis TaxID=76890 RepID=UPI001AE3C3D2|nr:MULTISPECIES: hypothetical protein [Asticcacaulis]MBP2159617.1 hypothetical protein [Asticcacaulis solisilvae]MDR6800556.1 hypothetical protein [Asticcacaulis sp. BE141]
MTDRAPLPSHVIQWLNTLQQALRPLPQAERDDIIREARAHLEDRIAAGLSPENALHGFGDARAYARGFLDDHSLNTALTSKRIIPMLKTLTVFAGRSTLAFFGLMGTLIAGGIGLSSAISLIIEIFRPELVGLWYRAEDHNTILRLGTWTPPEGATDIAGAWIYPLLIVLILVGFLMARYCVVGTLKTIKGKREQLAAA